ncbi:hypothetical protein P3T27_002646 [Kitasatospora sp. MAA19]|nr:hypothetical protein [Kitasatospora sp. MAA19]
MSWNFRQIRPTVDFDRPLRAAIELRDQCVALFVFRRLDAAGEEAVR